MLCKKEMLCKIRRLKTSVCDRHGKPSVIQVTPVHEP